MGRVRARAWARMRTLSLSSRGGVRACVLGWAPTRPRALQTDEQLPLRFYGCTVLEHSSGGGTAASVRQL
jgi:hypothetical protein